MQIAKKTILLLLKAKVSQDALDDVTEYLNEALLVTLRPFASYKAAPTWAFATA